MTNIFIMTLYLLLLLKKYIKVLFKIINLNKCTIVMFYKNIKKYIMIHLYI